MRALGTALVAIAVAGCATDSARSAVELWIGGDVHIGDDSGDPLAGIDPLIDGAAGIVNLEGPIGDGAAASTAERLVNGHHAPGILLRHGVAVAGVDNNHRLDLGAAGAASTIARLRLAGIAAAGPSPAYLDVGGRRIAVTAHDLGAGVPNDLHDTLEAAARDSDHLVATFHVTGPPSYLPGADLARAVDIAIAAGAQVVAAHGSHAVARVERRGTAVIAWGLGNLAFACPCTQETDGIVLRVSLGDGAPVARAVPIDAGLAGAPAAPASDPQLALELLANLGSTALSPDGAF